MRLKNKRHAQALCGSEKGRAYAGDDHEAEHPALRHDIHGMYRRSGDAGNKPYLPKNDPKYAAITESQRKMAEPVEIKGQALASDEPICVVSVTVLYISSWNVCFLNSRLGYREGLSMLYLYIGAAVPVVLLLLRQALDFSYKEELVMASLADYVEQVRTWVEEVPVAEKPDPVLQEEIVDKITRSIRQTAATGSHFSKMLSPEEEEIMREIIREFMNAE